jgi:hypothetical protein
VKKTICILLLTLLVQAGATETRTIINTTDEDMLCYSVQLNKKVVWKYVEPGKLAMLTDKYYDICLNEKKFYKNGKMILLQDKEYKDILKAHNVFNFTRFIGKDKASVEKIYGKPAIYKQFKPLETNATQLCVYYREQFYYDKNDHLLYIVYPSGICLDSAFKVDEKSLLYIKVYNKKTNFFDIPLAPWILKDYALAYKAVQPVYMQKEAAVFELGTQSYEWRKPMNGIKNIIFSSNGPKGMKNNLDCMIIEFE